ncbi:protein kinase domain-containing protein [Altererythrobacter sp.]|uniref:protein kinase domain-containing protein n=1 Tax=Altererythrobacter sp. TaxID=1872480 RepID=UPI003D0730A9
MPHKAATSFGEGEAVAHGAGASSARLLSVTLGQYSTAGTKAENQDFHGSLQPDGSDLAAKGIAVALADGISTSRLGAAAAETAVKSFLTDYYCTSPAWSVQTSAERVIAATNGWMHAQNAASGRVSDETREAGLICTLSALVLKSRSAHIFHVGDSRVARITASAVEPLTEAHRISVGGGESYLARALGMNRHVEIDHCRVPVEVGDMFLLTSDGVHEVLPVAAVLRIMRECGDLDQAARALCEAALAAGSTDNLTAQLVRIESLPKGELDDLLDSGAQLVPAPLLKAGDSFEGYMVLRQLHASARSHVYLARDEADGARVVLKVPSTEHAQDSRQLAALQLEEWAMQRLSHQNLLRAAPVHGHRRHLFTATEFVEGQSLVEWIADHPQPDLAKVRDIVRQIASGLLAMHRREMVHRDLRPHNVLIDEDGTVKIIDFGSVAVAGVREIAPPAEGEAAYAGTLQYSAPELYRGMPAGPASDLYSLGTIAYQLLTGALPYGSKLPSVATQGKGRMPRYIPATTLNPDVPEWMDAAIAKAVHPDPARRYEELSEFTYDLAHPNSGLASPEPLPLLSRGSAEFWRIIAGLLTLALAISIFTRPDL